MPQNNRFQNQPSPWLLTSIRNSTISAMLLNSQTPNQLSPSFFQLQTGGSQSRLTSLGRVSTHRGRLIDALLAAEMREGGDIQASETKEMKLQTSERASLSMTSNEISIGTSNGPRQTLWVASPSELDVLCGRGGKSNHWTGNKRYRQVISSMRRNYRDIETKAAKTDLSAAIVSHVHSYGGRFLRLERTTGKYYVLSTAEARKKTSQALRESKDPKWIG